MSEHKEVSEHLVDESSSSSSNESECLSPKTNSIKPEVFEPPFAFESQMIANDEDSVAVAVHPHPPLRRSSSLDTQREVTPNKDETVEDFVFRILGKQILKLVITSEAAASNPSFSKKMSLSYRAVCRAWRDTIHDICFDNHQPLFEYSSYWEHWKPDWPLLRNLKSLTSLLSSSPDSGVSSSVLPPVSLVLRLDCPDRFLGREIEYEAAVFNCLRKMEMMMLKLTLTLPKKSLEGMDCSVLHLENLKYAKFRWFKPSTSDLDASFKIIKDVIRVAPSLETLVIECGDDESNCTNLPELPLPKSLRKLRLRKVKPPMWLIDVAPTLINLKRLILNVPPGGVPGAEPVGQEESLLIAKLGKSLESLELREILLQQPYQLEQPPTFSVSEPMHKLHTLKLDLSNRKVGELKNYKELLPSLTDLKVNGRWDELHFPASWYSSPCFTLKRLSIHLIAYVYSVPPQPLQLLLGLSRNLPNLEELQLMCDEFEGNNWQVVFCHEFRNLRKLTVQCEKVRSEGRNRLAAAVSGIPLEELQVILRGEKRLGEVINKYTHCPSLRDLKHLQELKLFVSGFDVDEEGRAYGLATDSSVMIYTTFLQMSNLKSVELSRAFRLTNGAMQFARELTGLVIKSVRFSRFEFSHIPYR